MELTKMLIAVSANEKLTDKFINRRSKVVRFTIANNKIVLERSDPLSQTSSSLVKIFLKSTGMLSIGLLWKLIVAL